MAKTPEGKVKDAVKAELVANGIHPFMDVASGKATDAIGAFYMPVAGPFSVHGVHDFVGVLNGIFWSIETKAPDNPEDETHHQGCFRHAITTCGGVALTGVRDGRAAVRQMIELCAQRAAFLRQRAR